MVSYRKYTELALKRLHKSLPELRIGHDFLFVPPVGHVVRGFILETTLEIKGTAYFWWAVMPLYRSSGLLVLNYGERLLGGERLSLLEPELDRTIDRLAKTVRGDELARLKAIQTPKDFLQQVDWGGLPQTPNYQIDLALTHYMAGDSEACQDILDRLSGGPPRPRWAKEITLAQELALELRANPAAFSARIEAWEQASIRWLHLAPPAKRRAPARNHRHD